MTGRAMPRGGRRARDPIVDLWTHPSPTVTPMQLAPWWGCTYRTVHRWIHVGHPDYGRLPAHHEGGATREWMVWTSDARWYEIRLFGEIRFGWHPPVTYPPSRIKGIW